MKHAVPFIFMAAVLGIAGVIFYATCPEDKVYALACEFGALVLLGMAVLFATVWNEDRR